MGLHQCRRCRLQFTAEEGFSPSRVRSRNWVCRECTRKENRARYDANRAFIDAYKLAAGCADCGYKVSPVALEFDHLPGSDKTGKVSDLAGCRNLARVKEEIAKCEVVCSNCHAIRTAERGQSAAWWTAWREGNRGDVTPVESAWGQLFSLDEIREVS